MIETKRIRNDSNNATFQSGVIEKKHQTSVLVEMKKKEDFTHIPQQVSHQLPQKSQKERKIWILLMFFSIIGGLIFLFLIRKSLENIHQELISLHQDIVSCS